MHPPLHHPPHPLHPTLLSCTTGTIAFTNTILNIHTVTNNNINELKEIVKTVPRRQRRKRNPFNTSTRRSTGHLCHYLIHSTTTYRNCPRLVNRPRSSHRCQEPKLLRRSRGLLPGPEPCDVLHALHRLHHAHCSIWYTRLSWMLHCSEMHRLLLVSWFLLCVTSPCILYRNKRNSWICGQDWNVSGPRRTPCRTRQYSISMPAGSRTTWNEPSNVVRRHRHLHLCCHGLSILND